MSDKHPVFGLVGKTITGVSASNIEGIEADGLVIMFSDGTELRIDEKYDEYGNGWCGFFIHVEESNE